MEVLKSALNWYVALPSTVMIMIGIFLVGIVLARLKVLNALKSSIYIAAGMIGLSTMTGMFAGAVAPVLTSVISATGLKLDVIDLGIGSFQSSVAFPLSFYAILLPIGLGVNLLLIFAKLTNTFDVDIFN